MMQYILLIFLLPIYIDCRNFKPYNNSRPVSKYDKPNFIQDRFKDKSWKPQMPESWVNRYKKPFHPAWMDYCDPYHCNDYHKVACGLNRRKMRFKWFQSGCHLILSNMCSSYRGSLKYDMVATKYCARYVMFLRSGCPTKCPDILDPVCAVSGINNQVVLFENICALNRTNCNGGYFEEYEEVDMKICNYYIDSMTYHKDSMTYHK